jgi:hypothetical protein
MAYARFPVADSHAGQAQPPRWSPGEWPGVRPDSRGELRPWAAPTQTQLWAFEVNGLDACRSA